MDPEPTQTRRRGAALEAALLDAAWQQLIAEGYSHFTFDAVAARAQTSKPVLYRRWSAREEMLRAALRHHGTARPQITVPDTGSLREDLIEYLAEVNKRRVEEFVLMNRLLGERDDHGLTLEEIRTEVIGGRATGLDQILDRAGERGDVDRDSITPRVAGLPFELFLFQVMTTLRSVPAKVRREIVDDIFLPLVTRGHLS